MERRTDILQAVGYLFVKREGNWSDATNEIGPYGTSPVGPYQHYN